MTRGEDSLVGQQCPALPWNRPKGRSS